LMSVVAVSIAGVLVGVRGDFDNANVALVLMTVVVLAAIVGGRLAGVTVSVVAAMSFNFFHTQPYQSLRIHDGNDIVTVALLLLSGLVVGEVAERRRRTRRTVRVREVEVDRLRDISARVVEGRPIDEVWESVRRALSEILEATDVRYEPVSGGSPSESLPRIDRHGVIESTHHRWVGSGFALPAQGVEILVGGADAAHGRVLVRGTSAAVIDIADRRFALAIVDLLALALAHDPKVPSTAR
jgi:K+-sensing histidine kinase KdpD